MILVYTTVDTRSTALDLAQKSIKEDFAVCAQVTADLTSLYRWEGKIQQNFEVGILFKILLQNQDSFVAWLSNRHPYEIPAIIWGKISVSEPFFTYALSL